MKDYFVRVASSVNAAVNMLRMQKKKKNSKVSLFCFRKHSLKLQSHGILI